MVRNLIPASYHITTRCTGAAVAPFRFIVGPAMHSSFRAAQSTLTLCSSLDFAETEFAATKIILVIFALLFVASFVTGQPMEQERNRPNGGEQELRKLESQWQDALMHRDAAMLDRLMDDEYTLITVTGEVVNKAKVLAEIESINATADVRNTEVNVRVYGEVAVVTGLVLITGKFNDKDVSTRSRYTKVYLRRRGQWRVVAAQATLITP